MNSVFMGFFLAWGNNARYWDEGIGDIDNKYYIELELSFLRYITIMKKGDRIFNLIINNELIVRWLAA
jgi:hypothetical protein